MRSITSISLLVVFLFGFAPRSPAADVRLAPEARGALPLDRVGHHELPLLDLARSVEGAPGRDSDFASPLRVGVERDTDLTLANSGTWETLPGGDRLWRLRVTSPGATWLVLGFSTFRPGGAELTVYDPLRSREHGPYAVSEARAHGQLWIPPIPGDTAVAELRWPASRRNEPPTLRLSTVSHGYRKLASVDPLRTDAEAAETPLTADFCNVDVNCPAGDAVTDVKRAVVQLLYRGSALCSGSLINTTAGDCRPYVLTAAHCISEQGSAAAMIFRFDHERPFCEAGTPPPARFVSGARLVATHSNSDFTLLEVDGEIPSDLAVHYAGWDRSTVPAAESWTVHHPLGDVKKVSYDAHPLISGQPSGWGVSHWRVTGWDLGTTEPGSSGAPLVDAAGRIRGQLHGGIASCAGGGWDEFGKLLAAWTGGGSPTTRLSDWLDPSGTNVMARDGIDRATCLAPRPRLVPTAIQIDDASGNADGAADPAETIGLAVRLANLGNLPATEITATLSTPSTATVLIESTAAWPNILPGAEESTAQPHFRIVLDAATPCGQIVPLSLEVSSAELGIETLDIELRSGTAEVEVWLSDDMESENPLWDAPDGGFERTSLDSASASMSWHAGEPAVPTTADLVLAPAMPLPPASRLRFQHRHNTEHGGDGGVLEYSVDAGDQWFDAGPLIVAGGYGGSIAGGASALAGRAGWTGDSIEWREVQVDLASLAGEALLLRWRFATDDSVADEGWFVDDVTIEAVSYRCDVETDRRVGRTLGSTPRRDAGARRAGSDRRR